MQKKILILFLLATGLSGFSQKTLIVEKIGTPVRYTFHAGDYIKIRTKKDNLPVKSYLWTLTDSSIAIGPRTKIALPDIGAVYKQYHFPKLMIRFMFIAGAGYFILDSFNNLINNEKVFEPQTMIISSALIAASAAIIPLSQKKCRIGIRWKVKVLDINIL